MTLINLYFYSSYRLVILVVLSLVCGAAVVKQERRLIILMTSIGGSYMVFAGVDHFVRSGYVEAMRGIFIKDELPPVLPSAGNLHLYPLMYLSPLSPPPFSPLYSLLSCAGVLLDKDGYLGPRITSSSLPHYSLPFVFSLWTTC